MGDLPAHRVVVIGSGFGGLFATKQLRRERVRVILIDRTPYHLFQPLLYQLATGILSEGEIAPAAREVLKRQRNVRVLLGEVSHIDLTARTVTSSAAGLMTVTPYDSLIVAAGAGQSYFGNEQFAQFAPGLKSIDDALTLRGQIFGAFEMAELETDPQRQAAWLTFVVVGGGPTGVEMAGQLAELSRRGLTRNFTAFDPADARVILVEAGHGLLTDFGGTLSRRAQRSLEHLGVDVRLDTSVTDVDAAGVTTRAGDGSTQRIASNTKVWAAGVSASPLGGLLAGASGAQLTRSGQVEVLPDCTIPGYSEVFVVGDLMRLGQMPGVAQVAIQSGKFAARQIARRVRGRDTEHAFHYRDKGTMATISRFKAIAIIGPLRVSGLPAWLLWLGVHLVYLIGFKNRLTVLLHWAVTFVGRGRSERTAPRARLVAPPPDAQASRSPV
ncbi:MAG: hypothetical protein QOK11_2339 [Pseudonocardiales bacterium]|nr:hypothetical protein [Pseudonocardiales bacterium]